ncbi:hypothetical protein [Methyloglobulus morosus]|nr:hypothetical protein [Methyloglobulus morosus]
MSFFSPETITWLKENAVDLIGHALTIFGFVVALIILGRQHKSTLLLQRDNSREELKLKIHELLVQKIRTISSANSKAKMYAFMIPFNIENYQVQVERGMWPSPIKERAPDFSRLHFEANYPLSELIEEFEAWAIVLPGIEVFQVALNSANHNAQNAFQSLFNVLCNVLPLDPPPEAPSDIPRPVIQPALSSEELLQLKGFVDRYTESLDEIACYLHDLIIESQNNLLSGLFERRVPPRNPIDPIYKVISTEPTKAKQLLHYFENESLWGKAKKLSEAEVHSKLEKP